MATRKGGLRVPRTRRVGEQEGADIHNKWDSFAAVKKAMEDMGFPPKQEPEFPCPRLTADNLTTQDSRSYTEIYVNLLEWWNYSSYRLAMVKAEILQLKNEMDHIEMTTRIRLRGEGLIGKGKDKLALQDVKDVIGTDIRYVELKQRLQQLEQFKDIMSPEVEGIERSLRVVSRQVEIRRLDFEQSQTGGHMPGRGRRNLSA